MTETEPPNSTEPAPTDESAAEPGNEAAEPETVEVTPQPPPADVVATDESEAPTTPPAEPTPPSEAPETVEVTPQPPPSDVAPTPTVEVTAEPASDVASTVEVTSPVVAEAPAEEPRVNDSVLISIDRIDFSYSFWRRFQAYFVVVSCDTNGKIYISESPQTYPLLHRPIRNKPGRIDFGFDGYPIYVSVGAVPSLVKYEVFVVRDRSRARETGVLLNEVGNSGLLDSTIGGVKSALTAAGSVAGAAIGGAVEAAIGPVTQIVGATIAGMGDKVVAACSGSKIFDARTLAQNELTATADSEGGNVTTELDILLFDRRDDAYDSGVGASLPSLHKEL